ncbi:MAG TPA: IclR family transcriptional regulator [Trinickia sp.]|nr:IclR family transcriptional regulator [Trinickia sp.]
MNSLLKSLEIIEAVSEHQPISLSELSRLLNMPKSSVQRVLVTFQEAGWLRQTGAETTRWEIGPRVMKVRPAALRGGALYQAARQPMLDLCNAVNETVYLSVPDGTNSMVLIDETECKQVVRTSHPIGDLSPFHATANGLALLAHMREADVATILKRDLPKYAENTLSDPVDIRAELQRIRERGYSVNYGQYRSAVYAIGAPVFDAEGVAVASVCISMPATRFDSARVDSWGKQVMATAAAIGASPAKVTN